MNQVASPGLMSVCLTMALVTLGAGSVSEQGALRYDGDVVPIRPPQYLVWGPPASEGPAQPSTILAEEVSVRVRCASDVMLVDMPGGWRNRPKDRGLHVASLSTWGLIKAQTASLDWVRVNRLVYHESGGFCELEHRIDCAVVGGDIISTRVIEVLESSRGKAEPAVRLHGETSGGVRIRLPQAEEAVLRDAGAGTQIAMVTLCWPTDRPLFRVTVRDALGKRCRYLVDAETAEMLSKDREPDAALFGSQVKDTGEIPSSEEGTNAAADRLSSIGLQTTVEGRHLFLVQVPDTPSWRDVVVSAVVATACKVNAGKPVVLLTASDRMTEEQGWFLEDYQAAHVYTVGCTMPQLRGSTRIGGDNPSGVAANLANLGWEASAAAVLVDANDLSSSLCAAPLCARLRCPLLFFSGPSLPAETKDCLLQLGVKTVLVVGPGSPTLQEELSGNGRVVTVLATPVDVARYMDTAGPAVEYVAVGNPLDCQGGQVRKLSLLSAVLASARQGAVLPLEYTTIWKKPYYRAGTTTDLPAGIATLERTYYPWTIDDARPALEGSYRPLFFPVGSRYAHGLLALGRGASCYLGASKPDADAYDLMLVDINEDGQFGPAELFQAQDVLSFEGCDCRIDDIGGSPQRWTDRGRVTLAFSNGGTGTMNIEGRDYTFMVTTLPGYVDSGLWNAVQIDLNRDGDFLDEGEGPHVSGDPVTIGSRGYALTIGLGSYKTAGDVKLTYPTKEEIQARLCTFYQSALKTPPKYLALVGYHTAVPFGLTYSYYGDMEDIPTDYYYGDYDADPFVDLRLGRVLAANPYYGSEAAARMVAYDDILKPAQDARFLFVAPTWFGGNEALTQTMANVGYVSRVFREGVGTWSDTTLQHTAAIYHDNHAGVDGWQGGPAAGFHQRLAPCLVGSGGCSTVAMDMATSPGACIANRFFQCGAVGYIGHTRNSSNPAYAYAGLFWDAVASYGVPLGEANRIALNHEMTAWLDDGAIPTYSQVACFEGILLGDPALRIWRKTPMVSPAYMGPVVSNMVTYHGPGDWWHTTPSVAGQIYHQYAAPGIFFKDFADRVSYFVQLSVSTRPVGIMQMMSPPIGWNGKFYLDGQDSGGYLVLWRIRAKIYNQNSGVVTSAADQIQYFLQY